MIAVRVTISRFVDESFPGWVECWLEDIHGRIWKFNVKVPVVSAEDLWIDSEYPRPASLACTVLERKSDSTGRQIVMIDTNMPWAVESIDGVAVFDLLADQLEGDTAQN